MRKYCLLLVVLHFLNVNGISLSDDENPLTLEQIVQFHTEAIGGRKAIEAVKTIEISITVEEPTFKVKGVYRADRLLRMRIDIYDGDKWVFAEGYDGKNGWQLKTEKGQSEASSPEGTSALWHGVILPGKLFGLHELNSLGHKVELIGREEVEGENYYVLKLTLSDGFTKSYYLNPKTWLIDRTREVHALHPDIDPQQKSFETRLADYRAVNGVLYSFRAEQVDLQTGSVVQKTAVTEMKINPALPPSFFNKP